MILKKDSRKPWDQWDILLAEAYQILQDERCGQCGLPKYICRNESNNVQFRIIEDQCAALVAKETVEGQRTKKAGYKAPLGTQLIPEPYTVDKSALSSLREPFYRAESEKAKAKTALNAGP